MKYQTNPSHGKFINAWGCNICSIMCKVEVTSARFGKPFKFSNSDVGGVYQTAMTRGIVSKEVYTEDGEPQDGCIVYNGKSLFNLCAEMFDLPVWCESMVPVDAKYVPTEGEEEILEMRRPGYPGSHFVCGDGKGGIQFDPIEGGSKTARDGYVASKRIYRIVRR